MTETTKEVFEKYQVRKSKKQKNAFKEYVKEVAEKNSCEFKTEKGYLGAENIIIGNPENAKVIYTAHYDTCPRLPFPNFITPKSIWLYLLYQIAIFGAMFLAVAIVDIPINLFCDYLLGLSVSSFALIPIIVLVFLLNFAPWAFLIWMMLFGVANKHTANDNTSGVTLLLDLMSNMTDEEKEKCALVFFDLEEVGLFGSAGFANKHKRIMKETLLINYDCISDGENILFVLRKGAIEYKEALENTFVSTDKINVEIVSRGAIYPSDQGNFKKGVGVAALKKSKRGLLYMDKIHTDKDRVYREENIKYLLDCSKKFLKNF